MATAKSPAMLFYLDNWDSVGPDSAQALGIPAHPYGAVSLPAAELAEAEANRRPAASTKITAGS